MTALSDLSAPSLAHRWRRAALILVCLGFGPLIYVSSRATVVAVVLLTLAVLAAPASKPGAALAVALRRLAIFLPVFTWMLLSALWSLDAAATLGLAARLAGLALAGAVLAGQLLDVPLAQLRRPMQALALGLTAAAAVVALDLHLGGHFGRSMHPPAPDDFDPSLFYARAATLHSAFVLPLLMVLIRLKAPWLGLLHTAMTVLALFSTASLSAKIALAVAASLLAAVYLVPRLRWAGLGLLTLAALTLPLAFPLTLGSETSCWLIAHKPSALHRVMIWNFVTAHIDEHPLAGWGLDAARRLPGGKTPVVLHFCAGDPNPGFPALDSEILPLHPHNGILQIWLELGGIGILLGFGPVLWLTARSFRRPAWRNKVTQAVLAASLAAALSVSLVSFGIWQEWFLAGLSLAAALALLAARLSPAERGSGSSSRIAGDIKLIAP